MSSVSFDNDNDKNSAGFLKHLHLNCPEKILIGHLNIKSTRNKFDLLKEMVAKEIYILMISKTKLDDSFPIAQFLIKGFYTPFRLVRNKNDDGIFLYV